MGGVTDGQTVIRSLKSIFSGNAKGKGKPFLFVLFTNFTPVILLILAGLIFWQRMSNEHINCYAPPDEDIRTAAVNQYCFVTGTYTILGYPEKWKNLKRALPYPGIGPRIPPTANNGGGTDVKYHMYFQWVPFVLLVQAILFSVPNLVWKSLRKDTLSRYCNCIMSQDKTGNDDNVKQASVRFLRNLKHHSSFSGCFIASEFLNLSVVTLAFLLSDMLLTGQFISFGRDWISYLKANGSGESEEASGNVMQNPLDQVFAKMSKCEFKKFGPGGSIINYDLLCVMTLNVFHDKVFLFLWFWFVMLIIIQALNLVYRLIILRIKDVQCKLILMQVEPAFLDDENAKDAEIELNFKRNAKQFLRTLGYSDWFLLSAIATSTDAEQFTKFFECMVNQPGVYSTNKTTNNQNQHKTFTHDGDGRGLNGWKQHGAYYSENLNTVARQNETRSLKHLELTRNRCNRGEYIPGDNLYSSLSQSLREIQEEEDRASSLNHLNTLKNHGVNKPQGTSSWQQRQQIYSQRTVDMPDGGSGLVETKCNGNAFQSQDETVQHNFTEEC